MSEQSSKESTPDPSSAPAFTNLLRRIRQSVSNDETTMPASRKTVAFQKSNVVANAPNSGNDETTVRKSAAPSAAKPPPKPSGLQMRMTDLMDMEWNDDTIPTWPGTAPPTALPTAIVDATSSPPGDAESGGLEGLEEEKKKEENGNVPRMSQRRLSAPGTVSEPPVHAGARPPRRPTSLYVNHSESPSVEEAVEATEEVDVHSTSSVASASNDYATQFHELHRILQRIRAMPFLRFRIYTAVLLSAATVALPSFLMGLLWGIYVSLLLFFYYVVSEPRNLSRPMVSEPNSVLLSEESKQRDRIVYKGWMNELDSVYKHSVFHVNATRSVLVRLEGNLLRLGRPAKCMMRHAFHIDPTLRDAEPRFIGQKIVDLTDATVVLRPKRLARRRWWSRRYPIHIRLSPDAPAPIETGTRSRALSETECAVGGSEESDVPSDDGDSTLLPIPGSKPQHDTVSQKDSTRPHCINLFARSPREKERWFHLFREASVRYTRKQGGGTRTDDLPETASADASRPGSDISASAERFLYLANRVQFAKHLLDSFGQDPFTPENDTVCIDLGRVGGPSAPSPISPSPSEPGPSNFVEVANAISNRIFFDFCRDDYWVRAIRSKIETKLATIHLPSFIEKLTLSRLDLGTRPPTFLTVSAPRFDQWGLWVDFQMKYDGGLRLELETRVNLLKLKDAANADDTTERSVSVAASPPRQPRRRRWSDEELPESPESSADEEYGATVDMLTPTSAVRESTSRKFFGFVERAAQTNLFQKAAAMPSVAKVMREISCTRLVLQVEIGAIRGPVCVNIPPPPSDRLWYGFRHPPHVSIKAVPQLGDRSVDFGAVSDWIESRLRVVMEKSLVLPNLDDIVVGVLSGNPLLQRPYAQ